MQSHWLNKRLVGAATKIQFLISKLVFTCQLHLIGLLTVRNRCYVWETSWRTPQKLASFFSILRSKTTGGIAKIFSTSQGQQRNNYLAPGSFRVVKLQRLRLLMFFRSRYNETFFRTSQFLLSPNLSAFLTSVFRSFTLLSMLSSIIKVFFQLSKNVQQL